MREKPTRTIAQKTSKHIYWTDEDAQRYQAFLTATSDRIQNEEAKAIVRKAVGCRRDVHAMQTPTGQWVFPEVECGKKFCPRCLMLWSWDLKRRLTPVVAEADPFSLRHVTLTMRNASQGKLSEAVDCLYRARREWTNEGRRNKGRSGWLRDVDGIAWKFEVHWSNGTGWHPHLHMLLDAPDGFEADRHSDARQAWCDILRRYGGDATDSQGIWVERPATRIAEPGTKPTQEQLEDIAKKVAEEVAKYSAKPIPLRGLPIWRIEELAAATKGRRFEASTGSLACPRPNRGGSGYTYHGTMTQIVDRHMFNVSEKTKNGDSPDPEYALNVLLEYAEACKREGTEPARYIEGIISTLERQHS